jgi:hypothetical protein
MVSGSFNDPGFLKRFKARLDARAHAELLARVEGYRAEGLLPPAKAMSVKTEFDTLIQKLIDEKSITRKQAVAEVFKRHPGLRQSMIAEANRDRV